MTEEETEESVHLLRCSAGVWQQFEQQFCCLPTEIQPLFLLLLLLQGEQTPSALAQVHCHI